jgi:hypothetical protein
MSDAFKAHANHLDQALQRFPCQPNQRGLFVFVNGDVAGLDVLSRPEAYAKLHRKLLRSYLLHGLLEQQSCSPGPEGKREFNQGSQATISLEPLVLAHCFFAELDTAVEAKFQSVGYGWDFRLNGQLIAGSALMHEGSLIHGAFFRLETPSTQQASADVAPLAHRRRWFPRPGP